MLSRGNQHPWKDYTSQSSKGLSYLPDTDFGEERSDTKNQRHDLTTSKTLTPSSYY